MSKIADKFADSFVAREPVLATSGAGSVVAYVMTALVTHGVVTADQASTLTQQIAPVVASVFLMALGFIGRKFVSPAVKAVDAAEGDVESTVDDVLNRMHDIAMTAEPAAADAAKHAVDLLPKGANV